MEEYFEEIKNNKCVVYDMILLNSHLIEYVDQTDDICMLALIRDYTCFNKIKSPTLIMKKFVMDRIKTEKQVGKIFIEF